MGTRAQLRALSRRETRLCGLWESLSEWGDMDTFLCAGLPCAASRMARAAATARQRGVYLHVEATLIVQWCLADGLHAGIATGEDIVADERMGSRKR